MKKHKHGGDIYSGQYRTDFSANINFLGPPESVKQAVCASALLIQQYPDVECRRLLKALADAEGIKKEQVIFGNGAAELIFSLALGLRPKKALLTLPGFAEYEEALSACGCELVFYERRNGFTLEEDYLEQITEDMDLVFLCNPNNPTGNLICKEFLKRVLERCTKMQVMLAVDECFLGFLEEPEVWSMKEYLDSYPNLWILSAFTKLYAIPGIRLGYAMCGDPKVLERMQSVMQPWSVSLPAQMAGLAALREEAYVARTRILVREERNYLEKGLKSLGFTVYPAAVNFIFFQGPENLYQRCLEKRFLIRDCSNYRGLKKGYFRIAVRSREENEALLEALQEIMKDREDR